ncbi:MAG TPA: glycosyltransferase [Gaiellaceae bacterium]|jgi:spore maturation protein CgeB|nr:glycosyltransferase [Gaiellaceae bacterium]
MRIAVFCHSLASDWNHGNAHFLRGIVAELQERGHDVAVHEPRHGWSRRHLLAEHGEVALGAFRETFPSLRTRLYDLDELEPARLVDGADLVLVHEWTDPWLVAELGRARAAGGYRLLFHDTHHRAVTKPDEMERYDLSAYDGVLAYGAVLRDTYLDRGWAARAWTWHEAADTRVFYPRAAGADGDLVWIGNWGDGERTKELHEFLLEPAAGLRLRGFLHGVRYPEAAVKAVARAGLVYRGWVANHEVPRLFAENRVTVHVPRRPYVESLPGIPTIRPFEALACGIPLVCSPWEDAEGLFTPGRDYLVARDGREMTKLLRELLADGDLRGSLAEHGRRTILARHTCAHRVDELLAIVEELRPAEAVA